MPKTRKKLNAKDLTKKRVPRVLIPGLLLALLLGWNGVEKINDYYSYKGIFPKKAEVVKIEDGDTFTIKTGINVRLIATDSPDRGQKDFQTAKDKLEALIKNKRVYLEYDRYQDDKYGRILAWVWVDCESNPQFEPPDYMQKSANQSNPGLTENPKGCTKGKLVNEELIISGVSKLVDYKDRGPTKYEERIKIIE